jgi:hypothetical protein
MARKFADTSITWEIDEIEVELEVYYLNSPSKYDPYADDADMEALEFELDFVKPPYDAQVFDGLDYDIWLDCVAAFCGLDCYDLPSALVEKVQEEYDQKFDR